MPWFVKTEKFSKKALSLSTSERKKYIKKHKLWIKELKAAGENLYSGYLINENKEPGGGGLLILEAESYQKATQIVEQDPLIKSNLVNWELNEWVNILKTNFNLPI